uniref:Small EDRK-rich factor-like N-terminal domain-containing protein n=1 Tax=Ditylenchus dipsaci TaxID=166011 RepID=A0A915DG88_9BILA
MQNGWKLNQENKERARKEQRGKAAQNTRKHDEQRKNLQSQPKECETERSLSRSSSVPKRNTASFQVDFTSDVIAKLERDREMSYA